LYSDIGSVQVEPVEFTNNFIDFLTASVGVNVYKAIIFDDIGLQDLGKAFENAFEFFVGCAFGNVSDEQFLRWFSGAFGFGFFYFDGSAFD